MLFPVKKGMGYFGNRQKNVYHIQKNFQVASGKG